MTDRIETMATRYRIADHVVTPALFAAFVHQRARAEVGRALAEGQVVAETTAAVLAVTLGDPASPVPRARDIAAYVNAGRWIAKCECGGAEDIDPDDLVFMCCACWNRADGHAWRGVRMPSDPGRSAVEDALLVRPDRATRNWRPGERVRDLERENIERGLPVRRTVA